MEQDVPMEETDRDARPGDDEGPSSVTTTRVHSGDAGSSCNTSCACHGESPLFWARRSGASLPSGMRNFKKAPKMAQIAASQSAVSGAATPPLAASLPGTPPAARTDGLPSVRTAIESAMKNVKRNRSSLRESHSSPSITATAIVPLRQEAQAVPATQTSTRPDTVGEISYSLSLMKSPSKVSKGGSHQPDSETRIVLHHETDSGPTHLVPYNAAGGAYKSFGNGTRLTKEEVRRVKREQRNTQGGYSSEFFFPTHAVRTGGDNLTDEDRLDRTAIRRATRYTCATERSDAR